MGKLNQNPNTHLTAKKRDKLSYPARVVMKKNLLKGKVLDFGCGFGKDVEFLKAKGVDITGYDKHYFPSFPQEKFDTIICFYVLNVLLQEEKSMVLMELSQLIKNTGKVYIAVRRDLKYEGFRTHKLYKKRTYQCNVVLNYNSIFKNDYCEIYAYQHYNQIPHKLNCPFCSPEPERELILESATAYALYDKFPVSKGHALIIPKRHVSDYFELTFKEQAACILMANKLREIIIEKYKPDGFNIGINIGTHAGQTVEHVHVHLIPRYKGDVSAPQGGVRGVIPEKQMY